MTVGIEAGIVIVDIHQIEEFTLGYCILRVAQVEHACIEIAQALLAFRERAVAIAVVEPAAQGGDAPVVEDGGAAVKPAVSFGLGGGFAQFLTGVEHERPG